MKYKIWAAVLSVLIPGLGQLYSGFPKRAIYWFLSEVLFLYIGFRYVEINFAIGMALSVVWFLFISRASWMHGGKPPM